VAGFPFGNLVKLTCPKTASPLLNFAVFCYSSLKIASMACFDKMSTKFDEVSARSDWCHQVLTFAKEKVVST
jgi:hypothetical protein